MAGTSGACFAAMGAPGEMYPQQTPAMALTALACKNARCPVDRPRLRLADSPSLSLEVTPACGRYWRWTYRHTGKEA
jgi:hypothetical protein